VNVPHLAKLTDKQKSFLMLIERSMAGRDWASVSDVLWPMVQSMHAQLPDLVDLDGPNQRVRPTAEGYALLGAMKIL
jgi:hypothetical protein